MLNEKPKLKICKGKLCKSDFLGVGSCKAKSPKGAYTEDDFIKKDPKRSTRFECTRPKGHKGNHVACGLVSHNMAVWPREEEK